MPSELILIKSRGGRPYGFSPSIETEQKVAAAAERTWLDPNIRAKRVLRPYKGIPWFLRSAYDQLIAGGLTHSQSIERLRIGESGERRKRVTGRRQSFARKFGYVPRSA